MAEYEDVSGILEPEVDPVAKADAAAMLAEQMRQEEAALMEALPKQRAEEASDYASWVAAGRRPGDVQPIMPLQYGRRMPTTQGYMYMGNALPAPAAGTPLAATRAYDTAMAGQNLPGANVAYQQLADMGLKPPGALLGNFRTDVPVPAATDMGMKYEAIQTYNRMREAGVPDEEAAKRSLVGLFVGSPYRRRYDSLQPMTEYQRKQTELRSRQLTDQEANRSLMAQTRIRPDANAEYSHILKQIQMYSALAVNDTANEHPEYREALGDWQKKKDQRELEQLLPL